jgi:serine phosphatase RsbU (regulator of sigma subunit)
VGRPHPTDDAERAIITTIGAYTAQALERARYVELRVSVARQMQEALLTDLPEVDGLALPATVVQELEDALAGLPLPAHGTLPHCHLLPHDRSGRWTLCYTNAGHPPPILIQPDGATTVLGEHDMMFGFPGLRRNPRVDHVVPIEPGTTVFLYTDGLIERRGTDLDDGIAALRAMLGTLYAHAPRQIVDIAVSTLLGPRHDDDVVALAITIPLSRAQ